MKIYLLRHEERPIEETGFNTSLTDNGLKMSQTLVLNKLKSLDIDTIFVSPYLRTLQTIQPYLVASNKKCNVEYALCEGYDEGSHGLGVDLNTIKRTLEQFNCNEYTSYIDMNDTMQSETPNMILSRVDNFISSINETGNVLICSHQFIIHHIIGRIFDIDPIILNCKMGDVCVLDDTADGVRLIVI